MAFVVLEEIQAEGRGSEETHSLVVKQAQVLEVLFAGTSKTPRSTYLCGMVKGRKEECLNVSRMKASV